MKVRPSVKPICEKCKDIKRNIISLYPMKDSNFLFGKLKAVNKIQIQLLINHLTITNGKLKAC